MVIDSHSHYLPKGYTDSSPFYTDVWYDYNTRQNKRNESEYITDEIVTYPIETYIKNVPLENIQKKITEFNDNIYKISNKNERLHATAAIYPVIGSEHYLNEMERTILDLGLCGFSLSSSYDGIYLDDKMFWPLFEKSIELGKPIYIHPVTSCPIGAERLKEYSLTPMLGFVFDTTVCIVRLILSGVLQHYKDVRLVFSHLGGTFPFLIPRIEELSKIFHKKLDLSNIKDVLQNVYFDTCTKDSTLLEFSIKNLGADKILLGTDFPAVKNIDSYVSIINTLNISDEEKENILYKNALQLLR
ncbi:amidohydrolase family protein [Clostridium beijerinckii]|uniref:Amidohydrolase n=1 Tax=Clostridium beijerinckii TaxID=1520 RepID=A0A1S8SK23_CLOBE|nr:amidohydrolase family protein [Clostridium beijerinckii]NRY61554.1 putative TIM-barrel fold metal-dependent hydrolase [Clostridium beijerinckii]OOM65851.1 amidohydrolase [Clostridium beijerinckii]